jgi:uncharacterized protein YqjF (DUF2071 family)
MPSFLTARWEHLILASYPVPPEMLEPRVPRGLELDVREGSAWVSLVGFRFLDTRVLGIPWPGHRDFSELNLRFYVRLGDQRGVCFVREFVPLRIVAWAARVLYNEPYLAAPMTGEVVRQGDAVTASYSLAFAGGMHRISATGDAESHLPRHDSVEHWFKEHQWGFGTDRAGNVLRYEVRHPQWQVHPVRAHAIALDFGVVYGPEWAMLNGRAPASVVLAAGSAISVHPYGRV